jgi:hypothetical protein
LFSLSSNRFNVDRLFPEAVPGAREEIIVDQPMDSVSMLLVPDIDGEGSLKVDSLIYNSLEFTDVDGRIRIRDRKITCDNFTAALYTGTVTGKTTIDLNDPENPHYTGSFEASDIEANDVIGRFTDFGGFVYGKSSLEGSYNARGWDAEAFQSSLTLDGDWNMDDGKLMTSGVVYQSLSALTSAFGEQLQQEQILKDLSSPIQIREGALLLEKLSTRLGNLGDLNLGGAYGFSGDYSFNGEIKLTEEATRELLKSVQDLPFVSDGALARLSIPVEYKSVGGKAQYSLQLDEAVKKAAESVGKDAIKDLGSKLKDLFKK